MFFGSIPALVTPFKDGQVDVEALKGFVEWQISQGSNGLVPCGTTGEVATLSADEHRLVIEATVEAANGRVPVIAGCGGYNTAAVIEATEMAADVGADAALCVVPYYNKPNQDGLVEHFTAVADASPLPVILYNVPGRTIVDMSVETIGKLSQHEQIAGIKDATGNVGRVTDQMLASGEEFVLLSGDDMTALGFNATGGAGCISVTANVAPKLCSELQAATRDGDWAEARRLQALLYPLHLAMFADPSPGPAKYALSRIKEGFSTEVRLPVTEPSGSACHIVDAALKHAGLVG